MYENLSFITDLPVFAILGFLTTILAMLRWFLIVVLICVSLMANDIEYFSHIFVCQLDSLLIVHVGYLKQGGPVVCHHVRVQSATGLTGKVC